MTFRLALVLLFSFAGALASEDAIAQDIHQKWTQYLEGEWDYEFTVGETKTKGTVLWKLVADGRAGTGSFTQEDGYAAYEIGGRQADSKALFQVTGYNNRGGYWHLEYTEITANLRVAGPMRGFDEGRAHNGRLTGGKIDEDHCEFHYEGKTNDGDPIAWVMKVTRKVK